MRCTFLITGTVFALACAVAIPLALNSLTASSRQARLAWRANAMGPIVVEQVITLIQHNALNAARIDWATQAPTLRTVASKAPQRVVYAQISRLVALLHDGHSFVLPPAGSARMGSQEPTMPQVSTLAPGIGCIALFGLTSTNPATQAAYVQTALTGMAAQQNVHAWVVDLRANSGGNMWPMLAALQPLLGTGTLGAFSATAKAPQQPWSAQVNRYLPGYTVPEATALPVAVLLGPHTASSGEITAMAFMGRPTTRFFGTPTRGQTTGNRSFRLPDGGLLVLATRQEQDRTGRVQTGPLLPDERVANPQEALPHALAWLQNLPGTPQQGRAPQTD